MNTEVAKIAYVLFLMMMTMMRRKCPDVICICVIYVGYDRKRHWISTAM